jgi:hypothetical protein
VARGEKWRRICVITGIPEWRSALQVEWRWKQLSRKEKSRNALHRRLQALHALLSLEKPTHTAIPYDAYPNGPPAILWDSEEDGRLYNRLSNIKQTIELWNDLTANDQILSYPSDPSE